MASRSMKFLLDVQEQPGNKKCADCGKRDPEWASVNLGIFICEQCAGVHRSMGTHISKVKSIRLDKWDDSQLKFMESHGNEHAKRKYEQFVPPCYKIPGPESPQVLREQWIRGKYERREFTSPDRQEYLKGQKEGYLWKRGKGDNKFQIRKFILSEADYTLKYYTKEDAKEPKATLRLDTMNVTFVPEKIGNFNALQITSEQDLGTRSIFLYAEDSKEIMDWYLAIRAAKLNRLRIAYPGADDSELANGLTRDFLKEGWLWKTGPKQGDAYRKRWMTLDKRRILYYEEPLDAFPKGEIFIGTKEKSYAVREGVPPGIKDFNYSFTLRTPERHYHFSAETNEDRQEWMQYIREILTTPMSPQDSSSCGQNVKRRSSWVNPFSRR